MGPQFRVSSKRPEKPGIEPMTPGLEDEQLNHYTTEASVCQCMLYTTKCFSLNKIDEITFLNIICLTSIS